MNQTNKRMRYSCANTKCLNPSDVFKGLCQYCEISQYGKVQDIATPQCVKVPDLLVVDEPKEQLPIKRRRRRVKDGECSI